MSQVKTEAAVRSKGFYAVPPKYGNEFIQWLKKNNFFRNFFTAPNSWKKTKANTFLAEKRLELFNKRVKAEGLLTIDDLAKKIGTRRANFIALVGEYTAKDERPSRIGRKKILESILSNKKIPSTEVPLGGQRSFYKPINESELLQLKRIFKQGGKKGISHGVIKRIDTLLADSEIAATLEKGKLPTLQALKKVIPGMTDGQATLTVSHIGSVFQGKESGIFPGVKLHKEAGKKIADTIAKAKFGNPYYGAGYKLILDSIDAELGREIGTFEDFKNQLTAKAKKMGIPLYNRATGTGFSVNELTSVRSGFKRGVVPYSQWVDLSAGVLNEGDLGRMQSKLSTKLEQLQKAVSEGRLKNEPNPFKFPGGQTNWRPKKGVDNLIQEYNVMRDSFIKQYPKANVPEIFTSLKGSEFQKKLTDVYKEGDLRTWKKDYGLDLAKNLKEQKIGLKMEGRPIAQILDDPNLSKTLTDIKNRIKGLSKKEQLKFCSILSRGGLPGNCAAAIDANPVKTAEVFAGAEATSGALNKVKLASTRFLSLLGRGGVKAAPLAAVAALGAVAEPLVKQFRNDDYSTYLSDPEQQGSMLLAMVEQETPKVDQEILKWKYPGEVAAIGAGAIPGAGTLYKQRRAIRPQKLPGQPAFIGPMPKGVGPTRAALGISGVLGKALGATFSPLAVAATLPFNVAAQRSAGTDYSDIVADPGTWMGPAFASTGAQMATKGIQNPMLLRALRLGFSPGALRAFSSRLGLPGLALTGGMWGYDKWKNWGKDKDDEFKVRKYVDDD